MKIRNHRQKTYNFYPSEKSKLEFKKFKMKSCLMKYLNANYKEAVNGTVSLHESSFGHSGSIRHWFVWYNDRPNQVQQELKIELRQLDFRGRKYIHKKYKISKDSKKYFAFSERVINLMCNIEAEDGTITSKNAKKLVELFYKQGFKDFEPDEEQLRYINGHIGDGIQFSYWSDRCGTLRMKVVIEFFKRNNLI
jgi:hypothetical protein